MLSRHTARTMATYSQRPAAARRIRRRLMADQLYCGTNGCPTHLVVDEANGVASCPICGYRRRVA